MSRESLGIKSIRSRFRAAADLSEGAEREEGEERKRCEERCRDRGLLTMFSHCAATRLEGRFSGNASLVGSACGSWAHQTLSGTMITQATIGTRRETKSSREPHTPGQTSKLPFALPETRDPFPPGRMRLDLCAALAIGASAGNVIAAPSSFQQLKTRNIVDSIADSYDFVVVGGGLAGLVLGARLSEDANHTVLVLESGGTGDDLRERIDTPGDTYYQSLWPTALNWAFETTPQAGANGAQLVWPRGKVLGGSSAINGMYMVRPSEIESSAWQGMLGNMDGAENWSWDSLYAAMKKSETYTPPTAAVEQEGGVTWNAASHGTNGPVHMSYPGYSFPQVGQWSIAAEAAGIADTNDPYGGQNWGAYVATSAINPTNWTRSYSRSAYLDPLPPRPNYDVLANAHVTRLLFNPSSPADNLTANAVEYTPDGGNTKMTVKVNKEVILAGGTVGSPAVLLYSGVGPKDVLSAAGVPVLSELPGVGQHLQDHLSASVQWSTDQPTAGSIYNDNSAEDDDPVFLSYVNSAIAYVNATAIFGSSLESLKASIVSQVDAFIPPYSSDTGVIAGYKAIYSTTVNTILTSPVGQIELLFANNADGAIRITTTLQHPFSQGSIYINSSNPMDYPVIDPNYLAHPADLTILREGLKLARRLGEASPLSGSMTNETSPGASVQSDTEWEDWLREDQLSTEFHPSSTCAMLPLDQGGVVDANLRVYGLANVRVADASVPPFVVAAHLMAGTYGLAEQASDMIRRFHNGVVAKPATASGGSKGNGTSAGSDLTPSTSSAANSSTSAAAGPAGETKDNHLARNVVLGVCLPVGVFGLAAILWFWCCGASARVRRRKGSYSNVNRGIVETSSVETLDKPELDPLCEYGAAGEGDDEEAATSEKAKGATTTVVEVPNSNAEGH